MENDNKNTPMNTRSEPSALPSSATESPAATSQSPTKKSKVKLVILLLILAFLIVAALLYAFVFNKNDTTTASGAKNDIALLRVGTDARPLNSFYPEGISISTQREVDSQIFEGLVKYEGLTKISPAIATGWTNPDTSTWIFTIRPNVTFHNGKTLTNKDVTASLNYVKQNEESLGTQATATMESIETIDSNKVKITTDGPDPVLLNKLANLYIFDADAKQPLTPESGSGPYTTKAGTIPSENKVDLTAYDAYYGGRIKVRELQFIYKPHDQLAAALKNNKIDIISSAPADIRSNLGNYASINNPNTLVYFLGLNTGKINSPLAKLAVRKAISDAVDRKKLAAIIDGKTTNQLIPSTIPGYNPAIKIPEQNIAKAKQALAQAGYPNGFTIEFTYNATRETVSKEIIAELAKIGVTAKPNPISDDDRFYDATLGGQTDMFFIGYSSDYLDGADVLSTIFVDSPNYSNHQLTDSLDKINSEAAASRVSELQRLSKLVADDVAVVPVVTPVDKMVLRQNYKLVQDQPNTITGAYYYKVIAP